ncbi:MAG: hypothetical protein ACRDP3_05515 [Streptomyces sp.]|uniref:hypothetical protein n=1 Tax=Streptomyces sp. TaxID=1931 RepID=UPI003D6B5570
MAPVLCSLVLLALHGVGGFFVLNALMTTSEGPWDTDVTQTARMMALFGIVTEALAAALTAVFIALARLRTWWYAIPALLVVTAVVRMVFAPGA